jgi:glycosyltransferase involved in cell wall biosynthesis
MTRPGVVSVVIPLYNAAAYVEEAIESVLAQTHPEIELIVVDDGSTDGGGDVARRCAPDARVLTIENSGEGAARNTGAAEATGEYLSFLDSDDHWVPAKTEKQLAALAGDVDIVFGAQRPFRSPELAEGDHMYANEGAVLPATIFGTMLLRRETFTRVGQFSPTLRMGSFMDWLSRARELELRELMLTDVVLHRRLRPDSLSQQMRVHAGDYARVLKQALDRRREHG